MQSKSTLVAPKFLSTLWAPFAASTNSAAASASGDSPKPRAAVAPASGAAPVIAGPYNTEVHQVFNAALNKAKCPDQSSSIIWNGRFLALPPDQKKPKEILDDLPPSSSRNNGNQASDFFSAFGASPPEPPKPAKAAAPPKQPQPPAFNLIHNYFACMLSSYDIYSTQIDYNYQQQQKSKPGKAVGSFMLKQERPFLGEWKGRNPYLKVDFRLSYESRGEYFLHLNYHCNLHQQLLEAGCPDEIASHLLGPQPSPWVVENCPVCDAPTSTAKDGARSPRPQQQPNGSDTNNISYSNVSMSLDAAPAY